MKQFFSVIFIFISFTSYSNSIPKANITKANIFDIVTTSPITNTVTVSFTTPSTVTWTVPAGVYSIYAVVLGGGGGQANQSGGNGGVVSSSLNVTPGQVLDLVIGGGGQASGYGGGGGGASSINAGTGDQIIAGGGGGSAGDRGGGSGGNGGNPNGQNGQNSGWGGAGGGIGGSGGNGGAGGGAGTNGGPGGAGGNGNGGAGGGGLQGGYGIGSGNGGSHSGYGGYGGGGYGGGGGGANSNGADAGGGGGGSIGPSGSVYSVGTNANSGPGSIQISYIPTPTLNITTPLISLTSCLGSNSVSSTSFGVTGSYLTTNVTVSVPTNFVIATSPSGSYSSSIVLNQSSGTVSSTLYAKLNYSATEGYKSETITASSSGASDVSTTINGTVYAIPSISITETDASGYSSDSKVCKGGSATLTASGGSFYSWSSGETITSTTSSITKSPISNTTYTVTGTTSGCSNTASITITVEPLPTLSVGSITLCTEATYLITNTTGIPNSNGWSVTGSNTVNSGYVTAGTSAGNFVVSYTDGCAQTVSATVNIATTSSLSAITDGQASYKINNSNPQPQGPLGSGTVYYIGYNGYSYYSTIRPTNTGYYKANNFNSTTATAGCPYPFYIFRCTTCPD